MEKTIKLTYEQSKRVMWNNEKDVRITRDSTVYYVSKDNEGKPFAKWWTGEIVEDLVIKVHEDFEPSDYMGKRIEFVGYIEIGLDYMQVVKSNEQFYRAFVTNNTTDLDSPGFDTVEELEEWFSEEVAKERVHDQYSAVVDWVQELQGLEYEEAKNNVFFNGVEDENWFDIQYLDITTTITEHEPGLYTALDCDIAITLENGRYYTMDIDYSIYEENARLDNLVDQAVKEMEETK